MDHTGLARLGKVTDHAWTSFTGCCSKIIIARQHSMHAECNISFSKAVQSVCLTLVLYLNEQWSNCGEPWGNGVPLPFLVEECRSPSIHDRCGWTRGERGVPCVHSIIS